MSSRRDFIRRGALWLAAGTVITPDVLDRLTWRRTLFPSGPVILTRDEAQARLDHTGRLERARVLVDEVPLVLPTGGTVSHCSLAGWGPGAFVAEIPSHVQHVTITCCTLSLRSRSRADAIAWLRGTHQVGYPGTPL